MKRGKQVCRILKEIRRQIAEANDIEFITSECRYQGDCLGTCPKCEEEVRYLERELRRRQLAGRAVTLFGLSTGLLVACGSPSGTAQANGEDTASARVVDTVFEEPPAGPLAGKVVDDPIILDGDVDVSKSINPETDTLDMSGAYPPPSFPGGAEALVKFLEERTKEIPGYDPEGELTWRVVVNIVIDRLGNVVEPSIARSEGPIFDREALRIVRQMPRWIPGESDGHKVAVRCTLPIYFRTK